MPHDTPAPLPAHAPQHSARARSHRRTTLAVLLTVGATASCRDLPTAVPLDPAAARSTPAPLAVASVNLAGRALAANCFQCHGTNGNAGELKIAGESASEIISELTEMRGKNPRSNIMNLHAAAYTTSEISLIATYFSQQGK
jgi:sulfide dehydrogenase cytochrome subunit